MHRVLIFLTVCTVALAPPCMAAEDFYTWTDEQGNLHISDSPPAQQQTEHRRFGNAPDPSGKTGEKKPAPDRPDAEAKDSPGHKSKKYIVPYTAYEGSARRIIVTARLNGSVTARLAMDTGAPGTIITAPLAQRLGLYDNDQGKLMVEASGIGGSVPALRTILDSIDVGGAQSTFVPTTITPKLSDAYDGLLGLDFVANYAVSIDSTQKVVIFEELPPNPDLPGGHDQEWWTNLFREFATYRSQWKQFRDTLDRKIRSSLVSDPEDMKQKALADQQYREADKLFDRLNEYARANAVPVHWKQY